VCETRLRAQFLVDKETAVKEVLNSQEREKQRAINEAICTVRIMITTFLRLSHSATPFR
jgi:hypothetical protein